MSPHSRSVLLISFSATQILGLHGYVSTQSSSVKDQSAIKMVGVTPYKTSHMRHASPNSMLNPLSTFAMFVLALNPAISRRTRWHNALRVGSRVSRRLHFKVPQVKMDDDLKQFNEALTKMDDEVKQLIGSETTNEEVKPEVAEVKPEAEEVKPAFRLPRLLAFDLDGTLWYPDMYMLYDGGAPFQRYDIGELRDIRGQAVKLLGKTREILHSLKTEDKWKDTTIAFVSCTDHPSWAQECLRLFTLEGGKTLKSVADIEEIYKADKKEHFKKLQEKTGIAFQDMIFFDNEMGNIRSVSGLGVLSVYTPDGLTQAVFNRALDDFNKPTV